jgi:uncharacterized membrane protein YoaK (UPF0700 family)
MLLEDCMTGERRVLLLRLGIIFTVTGVIVLAVLGRRGRLPSAAAIPLGITLVVIGLPMIVASVYHSLGKGKHSAPP